MSERNEQALRVELAADASSGLHGIRCAVSFDCDRAEVSVSLELLGTADEVALARWQEAGYDRDQCMQYLQVPRSFWTYAQHVATMAIVDAPQPAQAVAEHVQPAIPRHVAPEVCSAFRWPVHQQQ